MKRWVVPFLLLLHGCGPGAYQLRERTLSILNTEADRWAGAKDFKTTATDAYGRPLSWRIDKTTLDYVLEVRSAGPDGLPKNSDDLVVTRRKRHGESSLTKEATKFTESIAGAAASGAVKGVKRGLGVGGDPK